MQLIVGKGELCIINIPSKIAVCGGGYSGSLKFHLLRHCVAELLFALYGNEFSPISTLGSGGIGPRRPWRSKCRAPFSEIHASCLLRLRSVSLHSCSTNLTLCLCTNYFG